MLEQIERDVMRTHPDMHFFSGDDPVAVRHRKACFPSAQGRCCRSRIWHTPAATGKKWCRVCSSAGQSAVESLVRQQQGI